MWAALMESSPPTLIMFFSCIQVIFEADIRSRFFFLNVIFEDNVKLTFAAQLLQIVKTH